MKTRPLTDKQRAALGGAEATLYGDAKLGAEAGRVAASLRKRGLADGAWSHVYLTETGRAEAGRLVR